MTKRIILFVASLAVVLGLMTSGSSYAWFVSTTHKNQSISVSLVNNVQTANLSDLQSPTGTIIQQGDNLVSLDGRSAALQLENKSSTETQMRVSIEYTSYSTGKAQQVIYSASEEDDLIVEFSGAWAKNVNLGGICYFYYMGDGNTLEEISSVNDVPSIPPSDQTIPAISKIAYKEDVSFAYSGQKINVKVTFESKQADNITWSEIDSYDVSGLGE